MKTQTIKPLRKVLVVQNEPTLRLGFSYALSNTKMKVETAATGIEALEMIETTRFDIILLELRMPGMDGINVIEILRSSGNRIPIVLCTASHRPNATLRAIILGVVDFLIKPASPMDIRQVVEFVINPPDSRLSQALAAVRIGEPEAAIQILETHPFPDAKERSWLGVLTMIRDARHGEEAERLEEGVRSCFPMLASNPSAIF